MGDQQSSTEDESDLGTRPLVVVDWEYMEPAARELFTIWHGDHDLMWTRYAWSRLEKVHPDVGGDGEQIANSLVLLVGLAMLSSAFWQAASGEPRHPQYSAHDALIAIGLDRFFIGQLWPWPTPQVGAASPKLDEVLCDLGASRARMYAQEVLCTMSEAQVIRFFETVPAPCEAAHPRRGNTNERDDDAHEHRDHVESEVLASSPSSATAWVISGCPV